MTTNLSIAAILMKKADTQYEIVWLVRRLFRAMGETANRYLEESGLTAADRAIMEFLYPDEALTVPAIASRYQVTRQHVQVTVNGLLQYGLVEARENPQHKRSPLLALSELGQETFAEIRRNETREIRKLFAKVPQDDLQATQQTLAALLQEIGKEN